ncbi:MAG: amidase [Chloroflexi bacterium]|nr:amidase [Chloroflexota bacterium]
MTEPYEFTVAEGAALIASKRISPVELTKSLLRRIEGLEPDLLAWVTVDREGALAAARQREAELARGERPIGPLHGVPLGVKDIIFVAGLSCTAGFPPFANYVPADDAACVSRLRHAGATILGKTVTTQFALTDPPCTRNPWHPGRTPGGSSSGSAAAVAARMVPAALGTQTGGSTLRPAAYCGCVGFKPSFDRISRQGIFPLAWSLDHVGIIARAVEDAALIFNCMADGSGSGARALIPDPRPLTPKLGILMDLVERSRPAVRDNLLNDARRLEAEGANVAEVRLPAGLSLILAVHHITLSTEAGAVHAGLLGAYADSYAPGLRSYVEVGQLIPGAAYLHAQRLRRKIGKQIDEILAKYDCFVMPTASNVAPDRSTTGDASFASLCSLFGLPAISLPTGLSAERLPLAVQLVASRFREDTLLRTAAWCENIFGGLASPV